MEDKQTTLVAEEEKARAKAIWHLALGAELAGALEEREARVASAGGPYPGYSCRVCAQPRYRALQQQEVHAIAEALFEALWAYESALESLDRLRYRAVVAKANAALERTGDNVDAPEYLPTSTAELAKAMGLTVEDSPDDA